MWKIMSNPGGVAMSQNLLFLLWGLCFFVVVNLLRYQESLFASSGGVFRHKQLSPVSPSPFNHHCLGKQALRAYKFPLLRAFRTP